MRRYDVIVLGVDKTFSLTKQIYNHNLEALHDVRQNMYFVTETKSYLDNDFYASGLQLDTFSKRLEYALSLVNTEHVIVLLDDFYIRSISDFSYLCDVIDDYSPDFVRLRARPNNGEKILAHKRFNITNSQNLYRLNTQPAIWKKSTLQNINDKQITPWELERSYGIKKNATLQCTLGCNKDIFKAYELMKSSRCRPMITFLLTLDTSGVEKMSILAELKVIFSSSVNLVLFNLGFLK